MCILVCKLYQMFRVFETWVYSRGRSRKPGNVSYKLHC